MTEPLHLQLGIDPMLRLKDKVITQFSTHFFSQLPVNPSREKLSTLIDSNLISS